MMDRGVRPELSKNPKTQLGVLRPPDDQARKERQASK